MVNKERPQSSAEKAERGPVDPGSAAADPVAVIAPGRVNLIGEHTDYTGGLVFPMAIDRQTEIRGTTSDRIRLRSQYDPASVEMSLAELAGGVDELPADWGRYVLAVASELMDQVGAVRGLDAEVSTTIPVGSGLSSSAALEVATAIALGYEGDPRALAELARRAEHRATGVPTGIMDQLCIAAAQEGSAMMIDCGTLEIEYVPIPDDLAIWVRFIAHRTLQGSEYGDRVRECSLAEGAIGPLRTATLDDVAGIDDAIARRRARHVVGDNQRVRDFAAALIAGDYAAAGAVMLDGHRSLSEDFEISTPVMDDAVAEFAAQPGVYGARMTGGGFGGCVVILAEPTVELDAWRVRPAAGARRLA